MSVIERAARAAKDELRQQGVHEKARTDLIRTLSAHILEVRARRGR